MYRNEEAVGRAIADCGVDRSELFVTSKLAPKDLNFDSTVAAVER